MAETIKVERAGPSREVDLPPTEKYKLDGQHLDLLRLKSDSGMQKSAISEEEHWKRAPSTNRVDGQHLNTPGKGKFHE